MNCVLQYINIFAPLTPPNLSHHISCDFNYCWIFTTI